LARFFMAIQLIVGQGVTHNRIFLRKCPRWSKKYRRLVVRWERIAACFEAFLAIATIHIWMHRLIVG
jgi:hypothetical protein